MTLAAKRRLFFWCYLLVTAALYADVYLTVRGAIDHALDTLARLP